MSSVYRASVALGAVDHFFDLNGTWKQSGYPRTMCGRGNPIVFFNSPVPDAEDWRDWCRTCLKAREAKRWEQPPRAEKHTYTFEWTNQQQQLVGNALRAYQNTITDDIALDVDAQIHLPWEVGDWFQAARNTGFIYRIVAIEESIVFCVYYVNDKVHPDWFHLDSLVEAFRVDTIELEDLEPSLRAKIKKVIQPNHTAESVVE